MTVTDFSFAEHADDFDEHIEASIPGFKELTTQCVDLSRDFVQAATCVVDIGCSTGTLLRSIRDRNHPARRSVEYIGIDIEGGYTTQWAERKADDVRFECCDARTFSFENVSLACSLFTIQFIPPHDKLALLRRVHAGLVEGGALIIAEKVLASTARLQDVMSSAYHRAKRQRFTAEQILDKESSLRGVMTCWSYAELVERLGQAGFRDVEPIWRQNHFVGFLALK